MRVLEAIYEWIQVRYTLLRLSLFIRFASDEEIIEWCEETLEEARRIAFQEGRYEDVDRISDVLDEIKKAEEKIEE